MCCLLVCGASSVIAFSRLINTTPVLSIARCLAKSHSFHIFVDSVYPINMHRVERGPSLRALLFEIFHLGYGDMRHSLYIEDSEE